MPRVVLLFAASLVGLAQYPGQTPYPRTNPGGPGTLGVPLPGRGQKAEQKKEQKKPDQPMPSFAGVLKSIDRKIIAMELDDHRTLEFRRTDKTKFVDVKEAALKPGDHISIEATGDIEGGLAAVNVRLEAAVDTTKGEQPAHAQPAKAPPAPDDDSARSAAEADPDRPVLRRGKPLPRKPAPEPDAAPAPGPAAAAATPAPVHPRPTAPAEESAPASAGTTGEDPLIAKARAAAESFTEGLPNYVVQQFTSRFASVTSKTDWKPLDIVSADVIYENARESYRNLKVNGKAVKQQSMQELGGSWSTGEFGTILRNLLAPITAARFHLRRQTTVAGRTAVVYSFEVDRENSRWLIKVGSASVEPAYRGAIWIDKQTGRLLRIEMQTVDLPSAFPVDKVETATDYGFVRLGGTAEFLLPVHAETLSCQRGTSNCNRNQIDFRNYHRFTGEASITFEEKEKEKEKPK